MNLRVVVGWWWLVSASQHKPCLWTEASFRSIAPRSGLDSLIPLSVTATGQGQPSATSCISSLRKPPLNAWNQTQTHPITYILSLSLFLLHSFKTQERGWSVLLVWPPLLWHLPVLSICNSWRIVHARVGGHRFLQPAGTRQAVRPKEKIDRASLMHMHPVSILSSFECICLRGWTVGTVPNCPRRAWVD
jgi:hypothetical protein